MIVKKSVRIMLRVIKSDSLRRVKCVYIFCDQTANEGYYQIKTSKVNCFSR